MTTDSKFSEEQIARHLEMFPEGAPDVAIGGLDIVRASIVAGERYQGEEPEVSWTVTGFPSTTDTPNAFVLMGDLRCTGNGWFIGASAVCFLSFRNKMGLVVAPDDFDTINELINRYGPWASHGLYDVVAMRARTLAVTSLGCELEIPALTPALRLVLASGEGDVPTETGRSTR